jgi:hypothetical protein
MPTKLLREPLVHFLILGALLLFASSLVNKRTSGDTRKIIVTPGQVEHLEDTFTRANQRPPTKDELEGLIRDYIRGEVYYREALALGLDRDDAPIRQRLRTKMEFISEDVAAQVEPSEDQLRTYLKEHAAKFLVEQRFSFIQVYLNPDRHGNHVARDAQVLLAKLDREGGRRTYPSSGMRFSWIQSVTMFRRVMSPKTSATSSPPRFRSCPLANGRDLSNPVWACTFCTLLNAPPVEFLSLTRYATLFVANGPTTTAWRRTKNSTKAF